MFLARAFTMTTPQRCRNLWNLCQNTLRRNIPGAFVECGVWRGGSAAIMGLAMKSRGENRDLHLFDSFEGLPEPGPEDGLKAAEYSGQRGEGKLATIARYEADLTLVREYLIGRLGLRERQSTSMWAGFKIQSQFKVPELILLRCYGLMEIGTLQRVFVWSIFIPG